MRCVVCARKMYLLAGLLTSLPSSGFAQFESGPGVPAAASQPVAAAEAATPVEIADEPRAIDPASLLPAALAVPATVEFNQTSLVDVVQWLQQDRKLNVHLDVTAIHDEGILPTEPITDRLQNEPVYLLLDRLKSAAFAWEVQGDLIVITTATKAAETRHTEPYNLGEFIDRGFDLQKLVDVMRATSSWDWEDVDGVGGAIVLLGDIAFIRHNTEAHREIRALLQALRQPARRIMTQEPPQHGMLREKLRQPVSLSFRNVPLVTAIAELSQQSGIEMQIDQTALRDEGVRDRAPVSLQLSDQPLGLALKLLLDELALGWDLIDGRLMITTQTRCNEREETAVFDVRDMCRDGAESAALAHALLWQTDGMWEDTQGEGGVAIFPRPGILVVRQPAAVLDEVLNLLESYRAALKISKPRPADTSWMDAVLTRYYRLPAAMADALALQLPSLVAAENWRTEQQPEGVGTIRMIPSAPGIIDSQGYQVVSSSDAKSARTGVVADYSILVVQQTRKVHIDISALVQRLLHGDPLEMPKEPTGMPGAAMGGFGGFGGGFPLMRE